MSAADLYVANLRATLDAGSAVESRDARAALAALDAAQAEVRRLRALPVLRTCGQCNDCQRGEWPAQHDLHVCMREPADQPRREVHPDAEPPAWCPLRENGDCGAQDAPGSHGPAVDESEGGHG